MLRGDVHVALTTPAGTRVVDGRDASPWYLAEFADVTAFTLASALPGRQPEGELPLTGGAVLASSVRASRSRGMQRSTLRRYPGRTG